MFRHVVGFELKYQLRSPMFWGTSIVFFLLTLGLAGQDELRIGWGGQVFRNSPFTVAMICMLMSIFAMFIMTAFVASPVLRDDETGFGPIIQATPLPRSTYLFGRFTGASIVGFLAFLSVPLGMLAATAMPDVDPDTLGPLRIGDYLYVYFLFCLPTLFVLGAAFFALATATRSILATYVGALVGLAVYLFTSSYLSRPEFGMLARLVDPFGLSPLGYVTKHWTAYDRNNTLPPFWGLMFENRLLWCVVGLAMLGIAWRAFARRGFSPRGADRKPARETRKIQAPPAAALTAPTHRGLGWGPLAALTRFEMEGVLRSPVFVVLLGFAFINTIAGLWLAGDDKVTVIYPVTRVMIQTLSVQFTTIPLFVAAFYAGELVWRDRERRIHEIVDSTPAPDWTFLAPKILAILMVLLAMGLMSIVAAVAVQLLKGFTDIEFAHYFTWYLAPWLITMMLYAVLAVFVQMLSPHKFVGLLIILLYFVGQSTLPTMGFEDHLYLYATTPPTPLSDMNGVGKYAGYAYWFDAYWAAFAAILVVLSYGLWRRGASAPLLVRIRKLPSHLAGMPAVLGGVAVVAMAALGGFIYYNTHVLNLYRPYIESERLGADYEKTLMRYRTLPEPRITDVGLHVDLYPHQSKAVTSGRYVIENQTRAPLKQVIVSWPWAYESKSFLGTLYTPDLKMESLTVAGAKLTREFPQFHVRIYTFDKPLAPSARSEIRFVTLRQQVGFRNSNNEDRIVDNGTFLDNFSITPELGAGGEMIRDRATRRKYGLPPDLVVSKLGDPKALAFNYFRHDSNYVNSDITVTGPADQTLLAAGHEVSDRIVNGRRVARFVSEAPIMHFFAILSAKYAVHHDHWKDVAVDVYYHPAHTYNIDRFASIVKDGLSYYSANFSPYQFKQFRIVEFPDYNNFAQSFPGTVPYSEAAGFVTRIDENSGIDWIAYVTAHELGHQWWAHQIVGADEQGSTVLSETLAQYSSLMVMEKRYGQAMIRRFLKVNLDGYLTARGKENVAEPPLERVEDQAYVRYEKGAVVMYLLRDQMGEAKVNHALSALLHKFAFKAPPYPTSRDLEAALRAEAKPDQQQLITDLFQKITLYDFKVKDAQTSRRPDGKWTLTMTVEAHKRYSDGKGIEKEAPLDALVDIGAFTANPGDLNFGQANVLLLEKQRIRTGVHKIVMVVDQQPKFAGIDPYLKYIDRVSEDHVAEVAAR